MKDRNSDKRRWFERRGFIVVCVTFCVTTGLLALADPCGLSGRIATVLHEVRLRSEIASKTLVRPSLTEHGIDPNAVVLITDLSLRMDSHLLLTGFGGVGCVIGDGSLVLTAAHCLTGPSDPNAPPIVLRSQYVVSPYYGDLFPFEVVATDSDLDLAVIRPAWKEGHPALVLGTDQGLAAARQLLVVTRSTNTSDPLQSETPDLSGQARMEQVRVKQRYETGTRQAVKVGPTRYVCKGWSGSPLVDPSTRTVVGILKQLHEPNLPAEITERMAFASGIRSIRHLLEEQGLLSLADSPTPVTESVPDANACYASILNFIRQFPPSGVNLARDLCTRRPDSACAREILALVAFTGYQRDVSRTELLPEAGPAIDRMLQQDTSNALAWSYQCQVLLAAGQYEQALAAGRKAVDLNPNSHWGWLAKAEQALGHLDEAQACYRNSALRCGCQRCWFNYADFMVDNRSDDANALDQAEQALDSADRIDGDGVSERNLSSLRIKLRLARLRLVKKESLAQAEDLDRQWIAEDPNCGYCWWDLADTLRSLGRMSEATEAARKAVDLRSDLSFEPRLANCLAKAGRLDEAEQIYEQMLDNHPERARYWFWYAKYLIDHHPGRAAEIRRARDKASDPNAAWPVEPNEIEQLAIR